MLTINIRQLAIFALFTSFVIPNEYVSNGLFWLVIGWMLWQNRTREKTELDRYATLLLLFYAALFMVQILFNWQGVAWLIRLYGLTRCLCAYEIFYLCFKHTNRKLIDTTVAVVFMYNILYLLDVKWIVNLSSINIIGCLNLIILPYLFYSFLYRKNWLYLIIALFMVAEIKFFNSDTYLYGFLLQIVVFVLFSIQRHIRGLLKRKGTKKVLVFSLVVGIVIIVFVMFFNDSISKIVLSGISMVDTARSVIYSRAINQFKNYDLFHKIFGSGNSYVQLKYSVKDGHNFIIESLLIYGVCGLAVTIIETGVIIYGLLKLKTQESIIIWGTLVGVYTMYMFQPFYSTHYLTKLFSIVVMVGIYNDSKNNNRLSES